MSSGPDPLLPGGFRCAGLLPAPVPGRIVDDLLAVDETLPERLRQALRALPEGRRPPAVVLGPAGGVDPFGADPYLQSATFLTAAAALEADLRLAIVTRGLPARGFWPLFRRHPGRVVAQVAVGPEGLEPAGSASWG